MSTDPGTPEPDEQTQSDAQQQPQQPQQQQQPPSDIARRAHEAESLPLPDRADAFAGLHDELRTRLESGGTASA